MTPLEISKGQAHRTRRGMSTRTETHRLDFGAPGCAVMTLTFRATEIAAAVDLPSGLNRRNRRLLHRWSQRIFRKLNADERGMRIVTTINGRAVAIGAEYRGKVAVFYP